MAENNSQPIIDPDKDSSLSLPINNASTPATVTPSVPPAPKKGGRTLLIIGVVILLAIFGSLAYYLGVKGVKVSLTASKEQSQVQPTNSPTPIASAPQTSLFSGQLKRLSQNLNILKFSQEDQSSGIDISSVYYEAGKFTRGELKDYSRVIAIRQSGGPSQPLVFVLATRDYQSYILDDPDNKTTKYPETDWQNPYNFLDKSKVTSTKVFESEQPKEIDLNQNFALYFDQFPTEITSTGKIDKLGNPIYETPLVTNYSSSQKLTSPFDNLTIYAKPYKSNRPNPDQLVLAETEVIVVDSAGLPAVYAMTTPAGIKNYNDKEVQYEIDLKNYQDQLTQFQNKQITNYPQSPDYVYSPNMGFVSSEISNPSKLQFYNDYETAIPGACATTLNSYILNVSDSDLEQVGSVFNLSLYRLKDASHPLYTLAFNNKMDYYSSGMTWNDVNKGIKQPTLAEYVNSNPLLFVKDYWNRWVGLGEYDIKLPGGCGKPVIYLYPEQPTKVSIKFQAPIQFTLDIPKYADSWQVMAYHNGQLVNLKPELTDCSQIDSSRLGSEYAKVACLKNTYPYLYWTGNINSENYPATNGGWIVEKSNLQEFLKNRLTEVGLNDNEKSDFLGYWVPEILAKDAPYYRISFLQTNDLNTLFPMSVIPNPETIFRLFIDYSQLNEKPRNLPQPQVLNRLVRNGFTLVEWGGLKAP